ncbi:biopolymer transporter ExbD [Tateyamaria sp. Alg231-49]|uniref:ExbD/TolR family protein n=1 Tax=Tateyamaria sp. Alg231-49 TaxID=1922219 RepID=UPI000D551CE0|nr:biopolymer transporter ExbD [Tateyamaria sp. Alg231-49]
MIRPARQNPKRDPSIALINVIFIMLIFFLIAGTIAPPLDSDLQLVDTAGLEGRDPSDALVLREDGTLSFRGAPIDADAYMSTYETGPVRIVPDRNASGPRVIEVSAILRDLGAASIILVTERALE